MKRVTASVKRERLLWQKRKGELSTPSLSHRTPENPLALCSDTVCSFARMVLHTTSRGLTPNACARLAPEQPRFHRQLTIRRVEFLAILRTPPHWVNVWAVILAPVVIRVIPLIKVNQEQIANHIGYRGNTDQIRVLTIHCFQLHTDFKPMRGWLNLGNS